MSYLQRFLIVPLYIQDIRSVVALEELHKTKQQRPKHSGWRVYRTFSNTCKWLLTLYFSIDLQVTKDLLDHQVWLHLNKPKQKESLSVIST